MRNSRPPGEAMNTYDKLQESHEPLGQPSRTRRPVAQGGNSGAVSHSNPTSNLGRVSIPSPATTHPGHDVNLPEIKLEDTMNLDERIEQLQGWDMGRGSKDFEPESTLIIYRPLDAEKVKQLISDVLDYVTPKRAEWLGDNEIPHEVKMYNRPIDRMEAKRKELGL